MRARTVGRLKAKKKGLEVQQHLEARMSKNHNDRFLNTMHTLTKVNTSQHLKVGRNQLRRDVLELTDTMNWQRQAMARLKALLFTCEDAKRPPQLEEIQIACAYAGRAA